MEDTTPELTIARRVHTLRVARGWTQKELAARAGVDQKTISNLEALLTGRPSPSPTIGKLHNVCNALGVKLWQVLCPYQWGVTEDAKTIEDISARYANAAESTKDFIRSILARETDH